jgi:hypothetical protein
MIAPFTRAGKLLFLSENSSPAIYNPKKTMEMACQKIRWHQNGFGKILVR